MSKLGNFTRSKPGPRHKIAATNPTCSHSSDCCDAVAMNCADWRKRRIGCWMFAIRHGLPPTLLRQPPSEPTSSDYHPNATPAFRFCPSLALLLVVVELQPGRRGAEEVRFTDGILG